MERVLLVDDEPDIRSTRSDMIKQLGFDCVVAKDGDVAIKMICSEEFDVILTDQRMPVKNGFDVLNKARSVDEDIPVIIFTGYGTIELAVNAMKNGAYDYIQKPVMPRSSGREVYGRRKAPGTLISSPCFRFNQRLWRLMRTYSTTP